MAQSVSSHRYVHLDAMRAIAALLVVCTHAADQMRPVASSSGWLHDATSTINTGNIGVTLFFMISGFVIPASLDGARSKGSALRAFAIRRFFRLYPVYWVSMLASLVTIWWLWSKPIDGTAILVNLTMAARAFGVAEIQPPYWTLYTELLFYLLCAGLFAIGLLHRPIVLATLSAVFLVVFLNGYQPGLRDEASPLHFLYNTELAMHLSVMFAGAMLRQWHDGRLSPGPARVLLVAVLGGWVILPAWAGTFVDDKGQLVWLYPNLEASSALGITAFLVLTFRLKPGFAPLVSLGQASYSLYLFHAPFLSLVFWLASTQPAFAWLHTDLALIMLLALAGSIGIAMLAYRFVERPAIAVGRHLSRPSIPAVPAFAERPS